MDDTKLESPDAAVDRKVPMLCTRCAALSGCSMIHHTTKAIAAHPAMVFAFTSPPTGAQTSVAREPMLARADFPANANGAKLPCRLEVCPGVAHSMPDRRKQCVTGYAAAPHRVLNGRGRR